MLGIRSTRLKGMTLHETVYHFIACYFCNLLNKLNLISVLCILGAQLSSGPITLVWIGQRARCSFIIVPPGLEKIGWLLADRLHCLFLVSKA